MYQKPKEICKRCSAVNSHIFNHTSGEEVCANCGLVFEERVIDETYEKRNFSKNETSLGENSSRVGAPEKAESSLGTRISLKTNNNKIIKTSSVEVISSCERGFTEINNFLGGKDISQMMIEQTKKLFDEFIKVQKIKGHNIKYLIAAMYFRACRDNNIAKSFKDIAEILGLEERKIKKSYNFIRKVITSNVSPEILVQAAINYIKTFCEECTLDKKFEKLACDIATNINNSNLLEGRSTQTIAGFSVFIANKIIPSSKISIEKISKKFARQMTLEHVYRKVKDQINIFIPEEYHNKLFIFN